MSESAVTSLEMVYPPGLLRMFRFCGDAGRFSIDCVRVDFAAGLLEATDGHICVRERFAVPEHFADCDAVIFAGESLRDFARYCYRGIRGCFNGRLVREGLSWFAETEKVRWRLRACGDEHFPKFAPIFASGDLSKSFQFCLNMQLLHRITSAYREVMDAGCNEAALYFTIPLDDSPLLLQAGRLADQQAVDIRMQPMDVGHGKPYLKVNDGNSN